MNPATVLAVVLAEDRPKKMARPTLVCAAVIRSPPSSAATASAAPRPAVAAAAAPPRLQRA